MRVVRLLRYRTIIEARWLQCLLSFQSNAVWSGVKQIGRICVLGNSRFDFLNNQTDNHPVSLGVQLQP